MFAQLLLCCHLLTLPPVEHITPASANDSVYHFTESPRFRFDHYQPFTGSDGRLQLKMADPLFPGGNDALFCFLGKSIQYPATTDSGKVTVEFHINEQGNVSEPKVVKSSNTIFDPEAIRLVKSMPDWLPGIQNGRIGYAGTCTLVIPFSVNRDRYCEPTGAPTVQREMLQSPPQYPGGEDGINQYLMSNIHYPRAAVKKGISGTVYVRFIVSSEGKVRDVHTTSAPLEYLDDEALRVVKAMTGWIPAIQNDKFVDVEFNLPVRFSF